MKGSGIYERDVDREVTCTECEHTWETTLVTDDWGNIDQDIECVACHEMFNYSEEAPDPVSEREAHYADGDWGN